MVLQAGCDPLPDQARKTKPLEAVKDAHYSPIYKDSFSD